MQICTSFYQFLTTNWCFLFTAQLLPGMKLESKFTFQGLLFISFLKNAHILLSSKFHMKMYSGFVLIFNNCVLICCKSTIFLNSYHKYCALLYKRQAFNCFIKCEIQIYLHFPVVSKYIPRVYLFLKFFWFHATRFHSLLVPVISLTVSKIFSKNCLIQVKFFSFKR